MMRGLSLIDKASELCGSDSELARRMGVHRVAIAEMRSGKRKISPETAAELADIAGDDAREAAIQTIIDNAKGTRREGALREILGKALAAGVAGMLVFSYSADSISATSSVTTIAKDLISYTSWNIYKYCKRRITAFLRCWPGLRRQGKKSSASTLDLRADVFSIQLGGLAS